ncbi:MAG: transporter substrate-binding domain-containing protein, partial [Rhizobiaceae bacterium]
MAVFSFRNWFCAALIALSGALLSMSAHASTLDDVISKKKVTVGVVTDYPPFSFLDSEQKPDGYEVEVAKMMGAALGVEVEFVPLTAANR